MSHFIWSLKQLLPLSYWTKYIVAESGEKRFAIWRMWFGRCFNVVDIPVGLDFQRDRDRQTARSLRKEFRQARDSH